MGNATASFVYDGDGKQIKATVNGITAVYVGNHYEVKNSIVTKYYFAGATRLAVRTDGTLRFLLGDHLGSSSVTTNASGAKTASALYKAFGSDTFTLVYDAENRLVEVKKNNVTTAQFTFDGDGKRVKSVIGSETILFAGGHYEKKGSTITKYYFAGATRIAMRKYSIPQNMTVEYMLGDHLGSTSITTDSNGALISEIRYKPWGETRYAWTNAPANTSPAYEVVRYQYTGQYSYDVEFGLKYYGARFYDSAVGRFVSADVISQRGAQGLDRYAYANNSPLKYTDPSGHMASECGADDSECGGSSEEDLIDLIYEEFGVTVTPDAYWNYTKLSLLFRALGDFRSFIGEDKYNDLLKGAGLTVEMSDVCDGCGGEYDPSSGTLFIDPEAFAPRTEHSTGETESAGLSFMHTVVHEMAHALVSSIGDPGLLYSYGYAAGWNNPGGGEWVNPGTGPTDYAKGLIVPVDPGEDLAESVAVLIYPRIPNTGLIDGRVGWIYGNIAGSQP